jgi:hypothetical protein
MGSLMSYKRPQGFGRIPVKKSGPEPSRWKAGCGESRTSGLERRKGCKALPIATGYERGCVSMEHIQPAKLFLSA